MAMPQRDDMIEEMKRTDALLEYAVIHGLEEEAERLREKLRALASMGEVSVSGTDVCECKPVWNGADRPTLCKVWVGKESEMRDRKGDPSGGVGVVE